MRRLMHVIFLLGIIQLVSGQGGAGFGYQLDLGGSRHQQDNPVYRQSIMSVTHNGFVRFHNTSGRNAVKIMVGYRMDTIPFKNFSTFLSEDGESIDRFASDAYLRRNAWKVAAINQFQFGQKPGKFVGSVNTGIFYERTQRAKRYGYHDERVYTLNHEINEHNLGFIIGTEFRVYWFTMGVKYEKLIRDMLNHDYILSQELNKNNSSELRGLKLNPGMFFVHLGVNIDFFE